LHRPISISQETPREGGLVFVLDVGAGVVAFNLNDDVAVAVFV
jgi:hypothetical protein